MAIITPTGEQENVNADNRRQLRGNVRDRIRNRVTRNNSGNDTGSSTGSSDGASRNSIGDSAVAGISGRVDNGSGNTDNGSTNEQQPTERRDFSIRIVDGNANGRNDDNGRTGSGGDGNRDTSGNDGRDNEQTERVSTVVPVISSDKVFGDDEPRQKRKYTRRTKSNVNADLIKPLKIACKFVFDLPVTIGYGEHWALDDSEANDLAVCLKDVLDAFPSKTSKDFLRQLEKWMPLISLAITLYGITAPRVLMTRQLNLQRKLEIQNAHQQTEKGTVHPFVN